MILEYPTTAMTSAARSRLAVRIHLAAGIASGDTRYGAVIATSDGVSLHAETIDRPFRTTGARFLTGLLDAMRRDARSLAYRHVDVRTDDADATMAFRLAARGARTGEAELDGAMREIRDFCSENAVALCIRRSWATTDDEDVLLGMLAVHLRGMAEIGRPVQVVVHGANWREDIVPVLGEIPGIHEVRSEFRRDVVGEAMRRTESTFYRDGRRHDFLDDAGKSVRLLPFLAYALPRIRKAPPVVRLDVSAGGGRCLLRWGEDGWRMRSGPAGALAAATPDPRGPLIRGIDDLPVPVDGTRREACPWLGTMEALLQASRTLACAAGRSGEATEVFGRPDEFLPWLEERSGAECRSVAVFSDVSSSHGEATLGVGYVAVGPDETIHGHASFPRPPEAEAFVEFERFASIWATIRAASVSGDADRYVVATDCLGWYQAIDAWRARQESERDGWVRDPMTAKLARLLADLDVPVEFVWQKGHGTGLDDVSVGNALCDRLAYVARTGGGSYEDRGPSAGWRDRILHDVQAIEESRPWNRRPPAMTARHLSHAIDVDFEDARALADRYGLRSDARGALSWDRAVEARNRLVRGIEAPTLDGVDAVDPLPPGNGSFTLAG